jgi:hypothetical protein
MLQDLETLDLAGTVAGAAGCVQAEIAAGCQFLEYAVHWATLNPGDGWRSKPAGCRANMP